MIKNVILFFLAICFILLIISYILNINQFKLWNSSLIEGANSGSITSVLAANQTLPVSFEQLEAIDSTLSMHRNMNSGVSPANIISILMRLNIRDAGFLEILNDTTMPDVMRLDHLIIYVKTQLKPKLSADGLILHYTLDEFQGSIVKNIAVETSDDSQYDGTVYGNTFIDTSDYKYGNASTRFRYDSSQAGNQRDYIKIPSIPLTLYKNDIFQGFTFATWYQTTPNSKPWGRLFEFSSGGGCMSTILASVSFANEMTYTFMVCGHEEYEFNLIKTKTPLPINQWIHIATTISPNGSYINYINGVATQSNYSTNRDFLTASESDIWGGVVDPETKALRVPSNTERNLNYIGKSVWSNWDAGFDGRMNDFRIYRKALSAVDILRIYNLKNPDIKYTFTSLTTQVNAKRENVVLNTDSTIQLVKDISGKNKVGNARGYLPYCPTSQVITIPVGQHLEITKNIENKPFTMAIVVNMYNFSPRTKYNYLIGGGCGMLEILFTHNLILLQTACRNSRQLVYNMGSIKGDSINIYIVKMDSNQNVTLSINGTIVFNNENLAHDDWNTNNICIGKGISQDWMAQDIIDFYELMYFDDFYSLEKQQYVEGYLAKNWGLNVLPANHPYKRME